MTIPRALAVFLLSLTFTAGAFAANPLPNPGFEEGVTGWKLDGTMSTVSAEAAHTGKAGLRVVDKDTAAGSSVTSSRLPIEAAKPVTLTFWAKADGDFAGVYLNFYDAAGKVIKDPAEKFGGGSPVCGIKKQDGGWHEYRFPTKAPEGAAAVALWIHSFGSATGTMDLDDFALEGIAEGATPVLAVTTAPAAKAAAAVPLDLPPRKSPPVIIVKVDDLRQVDGKVPGPWLKLAAFFRSRHIKGNIGIICETLQQATPAYTDWIKEQRASGLVTFWFHGWDHATHVVDGTTYNEFNHRDYEDQKHRFEQGQALAQEKLGFAFETFGPPGGVGTPSFDATTARVMADDPHMKVWLYPTPIDAVGKELEKGGKVTILDRVWEVNFETQVGLPNFEKFVEGYRKHPEREYFVLQGHPMSWAGERFDNFVKIIDFLVAEHAVFETPEELAAQLRTKTLPTSIAVPATSATPTTPAATAAHAQPSTGQHFALVSPATAARLKTLAATTEAKEMVGAANDGAGRTPYPVKRIHLEGTLPHQGIWDESIKAIKDWNWMQAFGFAYRVTGDARYVAAMEKFLPAWLDVYEVSFNPIDETSLDQIIVGYDMTREGISPATQQKMDKFLRTVAEGYLDRIDKQVAAHKVDDANWQSHRIKLIVLAAYSLGDPALIERAHEAFEHHIALNIHPDGSVVDFTKRDALHYVVYDLLPLCSAVLAAKEHGQDWFHARPGAGSSVAAGMDWLTPYATGEKTHEEFVHSSIKFDAERAAAGMKGYSGPWEPASSIGLYQLGAMIDPKYRTVFDTVVRNTKGKTSAPYTLLDKAMQ